MCVFASPLLAAKKKARWIEDFHHSWGHRLRFEWFFLFPKFWRLSGASLSLLSLRPPPCDVRHLCWPRADLMILSLVLLVTSRHIVPNVYAAAGLDAAGDVWSVLCWVLDFARLVDALLPSWTTGWLRIFFFCFMCFMLSLVETWSIKLACCSRDLARPTSLSCSPCICSIGCRCRRAPWQTFLTCSSSTTSCLYWHRGRSGMLLGPMWMVSSYVHFRLSWLKSGASLLRCGDEAFAPLSPMVCSCHTFRPCGRPLSKASVLWWAMLGMWTLRWQRRCLRKRFVLSTLRMRIWLLFLEPYQIIFATPTCYRMSLH